MRGTGEDKRSVTQVLSLVIQTCATYGAAETNVVKIGCCHNNMKEMGNGENAKIMVKLPNPAAR
jgi:hypothetical protein